MINFISYDILPLNYKIDLGKNLTVQKISANIKLKSHQHFSGMGELSLTQTHHIQDFQDAINQIKNFIPQIMNLDCEFDKNNFESPLLGCFPNISTVQNLSGPVLFALESTLLDFYLQLHPQENKGIKIPLNALISSLDDVKILSLIKENFTCYKLKLNPSNQDQVLKTIEILYKEVGDSLKIRLDGNLSFSLENLMTFLKKIPKKILQKIQYLEDPLIDLKDWDEVYSTFSIPLALDENLIHALKSEIFPPGTQFWVVKPSRFGLSHCLKIISQSTKHNTQIIISSSFEAQKGMQAVAFIANAVYQLDLDRKRDSFAGLDTLRYIPSKFIQNYHVKNAHLEILPS